MIKIYGFLEGPTPTGGWEVTATCQCGTHLLSHISQRAEDAQHDIGVTSHKHHTLYQAHCLEQHQNEPFQVEWVDHPSNDQGAHQSDIEVVNWSQDELSTLSNQLQKAFPADHADSPAPPKDGL